jgi:iron complex outermembrane receptor protein
MTTSRQMMLLLATCSALAIAAPACAQSPPGAAAATPPAAKEDAGQNANEVVVTAQKREERVQDVPLSITVANQAQLQAEQVNTIADLSRISPSLEMQQAAGQNPGGGGQIRGIGTQTFAAGAVGAVGIVVDQVSQGNANIGDLFDVSRVEVLKGPQGTLFGLTTSAGVINIVTNAPDPKRFEAVFHTDLSNAGTAGSQYGEQVIQGVVNIPLSADSALRIAGNINLRQGVDFNTSTNQYDKHEDYGIRARYLWTPSNNLTINAIGDYTYSNDKGLDFFTLTMANPSDTADLAGCGVIIKPGNRDYCTMLPQSNPVRNYGGSVQIDWNLGGPTLTSISQLRRVTIGPGNIDIFRDQNATIDPGGLLQIFTQGTNSNSTLVTQEVRIASPTGSKLEYTAGAFFSKYTQGSSGGTDFTEIVFGPGAVVPIQINSGQTATLSDESQAVFGHATYHATDQLRLILGARYTHEILRSAAYDNGTPFIPGIATENDVSWKVGAQYDFTRNTMAYVTVAQGYKGPELNSADITIAPIVIQPELPMDYEAGLKSTLLDGRLGIDLSVFYDQVKGFQGQQCVPSPFGLACGPVNYSEVVTQGVELDVFGRPLPGLTINSGIIYDPVKYPAGTVSADGSGDLGGTQLGNAPLWKFTFSGEYEHPITDTIDGFVSVDTVYKSDLNLNNSLDPNLHYPGHWIVGGRIGVRTMDQRFGAAVFVGNLTNEHEPVLIFPGFPNPGDYGTYYAPQSFRLVGISLDAKF